MGCCFSCGDSSNEISNNSKETVFKFDNKSFDHPSPKENPITNVPNLTKENKKKELVVPNISVTPASPEIIETGLDNKAYNPSGDLRLDDYEEYPNYEPLRRMSADIREQKQKDFFSDILEFLDMIPWDPVLMFFSHLILNTFHVGMNCRVTNYGKNGARFTFKLFSNISKENSNKQPLK